MNPNDPFARAYYGHLLMCLKRSDEAFEQGKLAMELDPLNPLIQGLYSVILVDRGDYKEIISLFEDVNHPVIYFSLLRSYQEIGEYDKSFESIIDNMNLIFEEAIVSEVHKIYEDNGYTAGVLANAHAYVRKYEESYILPSEIAWNYALESNDEEEVIDWLELGFEINDPGMPYIACNAFPLDFIRDDPRFIELLKKMNLPLE
jgi:tetratricopeptide (TPR) repeat protein